jgi:MFS family permease
VWGWRLPFLFSAALVLVGLWVRSRLADAEEFAGVQRQGSTLRYPVAELVRRYRRPWLIGVATTVVCHAAYLITAFLPAYATGTLGVSSQWSLVGLVVASAVAMLVLVAVGLRADRIDRRRYAGAGALFAGVWMFAAFALAESLGGPGLVIGMTVGFAAVTVQSTLLPSLLAEQFPVHVRYTGVSACFHLSALLAGALLPLLASWLVGLSGDASWPASVLMLAAGLVSLLGAARCRPPAVTPARKRRTPR